MSAQIHTGLQVLAQRILLAHRKAVLMAQWEENIRNTGICTFQLPNGIILSIVGDPGPQLETYLIMRIGGGPDGALPFEDSFQRGVGLCGDLKPSAALSIVAQFAAIPATPQAPAAWADAAAANVAARPFASSIGRAR
ncbi:hypothetical protein [Ramlibacter humi]|uniref:Uncharacterized protein n=1 Tax=Ramlibacter humi TaxID=2530451 RepID=A0A4Z0BLQ2_9BURK|nr:hypothetical protein [Ramlibacter humi]TFZ00257.1 hypothetical protein EZ216_14250 [Ramlibacter humi]